uniref:NHL repeat protein n=1 Tax=Angiostrongylus cantonensis TaxID=6313 RepID=A0A0K0D8I6_ANGCA
MDSSFRPVLSLGEKLVPGDDEHHFCMPTDIAVAKNGYFFIADGYCNSRVLKFDPTGKLVGTFGAAVDELGSSEFVIPHSLALIEDMNLICVADRSVFIFKACRIMFVDITCRRYLDIAFDVNVELFSITNINTC